MDATEKLCALGERLKPCLDFTVTQILDKMQDGSIGDVAAVIDEFLCVKHDEHSLIVGWKEQLKYPFPALDSWRELQTGFDLIEKATNYYAIGKVVPPVLDAIRSLAIQLRAYNAVVVELRKKAINSYSEKLAFLRGIRNNLPSEPLLSIGICQGLSNICTGILDENYLSQHRIVLLEADIWYERCRNKRKYLTLMNAAKCRVETIDNIAKRELLLNVG